MSCTLIPPWDDISPSEVSLDERRQSLQRELAACREMTLGLVRGLDRKLLCRQAHPDFSPVGWHLGHIAFTEALWILEQGQGQRWADADQRRLFAADGLPKAERENLPDQAELLTYLETVRQRVLAYLAIAPLDTQEYLWRWLLQHESQHAETIAIILALHQRQQSGSPARPGFPGKTCPAGPTPPSAPAMVLIPAGTTPLGSNALDAIDNERPSHEIDLPTYWIDRYPVTWGDYRQFMAAGGYGQPQWWSPEGWAWREQAQIQRPLYWQEGDLWTHHPVCGVSWYEADAYARFVGKRLPTEAEWEKAARGPVSTLQEPLRPAADACNHGHQWGHTTPVGAYPASRSPYGCDDLLGNVWEWTDSWFEGYPGFRPFPYPGYSQTYFDRCHRVMRGGSWATFPWGLRSTFRNWYHPHMQQMFVGFRCAQTG